MNRLFTRRGVMIGAGASATAAILPTTEISADFVDVSAADPLVQRQRLTGSEVAARTVRAYFIGTGRNPLGVSLEIFASDGLASIDVDPLTHASSAGCIESNDPAVCTFLQELMDRIRAENAENAHIKPPLRAQRDPNLRGEWINCPSCLGLDSDDCTTCYGRGCVWRSF